MNGQESLPSGKPQPDNIYYPNTNNRIHSGAVDLNQKFISGKFGADPEAYVNCSKKVYKKIFGSYNRAKLASVGTEDDQPTKKMKRPLSNSKSANWAAVKTAVRSGVYDSKNDGMNGRLFKIYDRFTVRLADRRAYQLDVFDVRFDHFKGVLGCEVPS